MTRTATARRITALALVLLLQAAPAPARGDGFDRNVRPLLQKHCLRCHGEAKKGDIDFTRFTDQESLRNDPDLSVRLIDALTERTMPPPGKAGPNEDERQRAVDSIRAILDAMEGVSDPGPFGAGLPASRPVHLAPG
jgi:hypothetical protein